VSPAQPGRAAPAATALDLLTRLPLGRWRSRHASDLARSTPWFPVVGLLVGGLVCATVVGVDRVAPEWVAAAAGVVAGLLVTGGRDEDGLAKIADSSGASTPAQRLAVMRATRVGGYGALAVLLVSTVRFASLSAVAGAGWTVVAGVVLTAHVLGRWGSVALLMSQPYAHPDSPLGRMASSVGRREAALASVSSLAWVVVAVALLGPWAVAAVPVALAVLALAAWWFRRSLGGLTGDALGATTIAVELAVLLLGALVWG